MFVLKKWLDSHYKCTRITDQLIVTLLLQYVLVLNMSDMYTVHVFLMK